MIEYEDVEERRKALARLIGIEDRIWIQVHGCSPVWAVADEDLERSNEEKTSSVHFLRFELTREMVDAVMRGAGIGLGIEHKHYNYQVDTLPEEVRTSLIADLDLTKESVGNSNGTE